jgi:hypothetical protein
MELQPTYGYSCSVARQGALVLVPALIAVMGLLPTPDRSSAAGGGVPPPLSIGLPVPDATINPRTGMGLLPVSCAALPGDHCTISFAVSARVPSSRGVGQSTIVLGLLQGRIDAESTQFGLIWLGSNGLRQMRKRKHVIADLSGGIRDDSGGTSTPGGSITLRLGLE